MKCYIFFLLYLDLHAFCGILVLKNLYAGSYFDTEKYLPWVSRLYPIFLFSYIQDPSKVYAKTKKSVFQKNQLPYSQSSHRMV